MAIKAVFDDFETAFAAWVSHYIVRNGFKSYLLLPRSKVNLRLLMIKDGYLYAE